jgi:membrane protease YdiL (CAAX protease family)
MFERLRALGWVVISVLYFLLAERLAASAATGLATGAWEELWFRVFLLFLLIIGYAAMGYTSERQKHPVRAMGLVRREGWKGELGLGAALGWGGMVACVLPIALSGGLYIYFYWSWAHFGRLFLDLATLGVAAVAEEVAFRGYPFQRLIDATGPVTATVLAALAFGMLHLGNPDVSAASTLTTVLAGWLLALAYLRTRALWVPIGFHFAWNAAMGILFGLPLSGLTEFSPVIKTYAYGPLWLTGGGYGPEGSAIAIVVLLALLVVMMLATRSLKYRWAIPEIVPGGIPVDIDAISRRQHEAAMGPQAPAAPSLVQIGGVPSTVTPATMPPTAGAGNTWAPVRGEAVAEKPADAGTVEPRAAAIPEGHTAQPSASGAEDGATEKPVEGQVPPETHEP